MKIFWLPFAAVMMAASIALFMLAARYRERSGVGLALVHASLFLVVGGLAVTAFFADASQNYISAAIGVLLLAQVAFRYMSRRFFTSES